MLKKLLAATAATLVLSGAAQAAPSISFFIDGDTFSQPFTIDNNSTDGEEISTIFFDLRPVDAYFDTVDGGLVNTSDGVPFTPVGGSDATTGLVAPVVPDGAQTMTLNFNDFQAGEAIVFDIDVDFVDPPTVFGNELIGAEVIVEFGVGEFLSGVFMEVVDNPDAAIFTATGTDPIPEIPVPGAAFLMAGGMAGLGALRRKGKKA